MDEFFYIAKALSATEVSNLFLYNALSSSLTVSFTSSPTYPVVNESATFTATATGNSSAASNWWWNYSYGGVLYFTDTTNPSIKTLNLTGIWSVTVTGNFSGSNYSSTANVTVHRRPDANFTIQTAAPYFISDTIQFNDTSTDADGDTLTNWYWDFTNDGTIDSTTQNATYTYNTPGEYDVSLIVTDSLGANSTEYVDTDALLINGFMLDVFDEVSAAPITCWSATISNSTYSKTLSCQNNTFSWSNFSAFPTGVISIGISASDYPTRYYFGTYNLNSYIDLDAYLLDSTSGIYSYFVVEDKDDFSPIPGALLTWYKLIGVNWVQVLQAQTDSLGSTFSYLSPFTSYRLITSASGYNTYTTASFVPLPQTYYIFMNATNATSALVNYSDFIYVHFTPEQVEIGNGTNCTVEFNDPDSNIVSYTVQIWNGASFIWNSTVSGSPSGGITQVNCTQVAGITSPFWVVASWNLGGGNVSAANRSYFVKSISTQGLSGAMDMFEAEYGGSVSNTTMILGMLILMSALAAVSRFGYGSSIFGFVVVGVLVIKEWIPMDLAILAVIAAFMVLCTRRWSG